MKFVVVTMNLPRCDSCSDFRCLAWSKISNYIYLIPTIRIIKPMQSVEASKLCVELELNGYTLS